MARFHELEHATCDVLHNVKQIHELRNAKLSVIGGLAVWHYLPRYRQTDNINFITNLSTSPSSLKKRLLEKPDSPFFQRSQALYYRSPKGQDIRVDISPQWLGPYLPESATKVQDLSDDEIPYISLTDLIVFKLDSSGLRSNPLKKDRDARDAAALVDHASRRGAIALSEKQEQVVEEALCDVGRCGTKEKSWWVDQMGLNKNPATTTTTTTPGEGSRKQQSRPHAKSDPVHSRSGGGKPLSTDPNTAWHYEQLDQPHAHRPPKPSLLRQHTGAGRRPGIARSSSHSLLRDIGFVMTHPKTTISNMVKSADPRSNSGGDGDGDGDGDGNGDSNGDGGNDTIRAEVETEVVADPTYSDEGEGWDGDYDYDYDDGEDDEYYTLEPRGSVLVTGRNAAPPEGYFDTPRPLPRGAINVTTTLTRTTTTVVKEKQKQKQNVQLQQQEVREHEQVQVQVQQPRPIGVRRASKMGDFDISPPQTPSVVTKLRRPSLKDSRSISFVL
ncbi:hypothetical protein Hte_009966 [Hypoxylon texense]